MEWDSLDANRERRERYHEVKRGDQELPEGYRSKKNYRFLNDIGSNALIRQLQQGDYIDSIFNQPETIHELVTAEYLAKILKNLSEKHKNLLFKLAVGLYSTKELGEERGQLDRNIRKIRATIMKIIHKALSVELYKKKQNKEPLTIYEKKYIDGSENI